MEDRYSIVGNINGVRSHSFYGVFDGHGGAHASQYCAEHMCKGIVEDPSYTSGEVHTAVKNGFSKTDKDFLELARIGRLDDGTTAVTAVIQGKKITVGNAGDSRAVLVTKDGRAERLSDDHKPDRQDEMKRIQDLGGSVLFRGVWRVEGVLAVSRAIGDRPLKDFVTSEPQIKHRVITNNDAFLVLATDGLWDVLTNDNVADILTNSVVGVEVAAKELVERAFRNGSGDNICAIVVDLRYPLEDRSSSSPPDKKNS